MASQEDALVESVAPYPPAQQADQPFWFPWGRTPPSAIPAAGKTVARQSDLVRESLQRLIRGDGLRAADALPSERVLSIAYNVARGSVRAALLRLREQGIVRIAHGQATRVMGRPPSWALGADITVDARCGQGEWNAAVHRAKAGVDAASFDVEKQPAHRALLDSYVAALHLLNTEESASTAVIAIDICHRCIVETSPLPLRAVLHEALQCMPLHVLRDALDAGLCAEHIHMKLWVLQASWVDRNCDGTKVALLEYLTLIETLCSHGARSAA